jgi:hypothetical protein
LQPDRPDEVVKHPVSACGHCGEDWTQTPVQKVIQKQAWDLPEEIPLKAAEQPLNSLGFLTTPYHCRKRTARERASQAGTGIKRKSAQ